MGFSELFQCDLHFMNEITLRLSALSFAIMQSGRGSGSQKLIR